MMVSVVRCSDYLTDRVYSSSIPGITSPHNETTPRNQGDGGAGEAEKEALVTTFHTFDYRPHCHTAPPNKEG